jgi:hypothetical protein
MKSGEWTQLILDFFKEQAVKHGATFETEYMDVDMIWRGEHMEIAFALEHEHGTYVREVLEKEVNHLIDLRAKTKVGIFYPNTGDVKPLVESAEKWIAERTRAVRVVGEEYLFILGFNTSRDRRRVIQFQARFMKPDSVTGYVKTEQKELVIDQRPKINPNT